MAIAYSVDTRKAAVLNTIFQGYEGVPFSIRLWDGWRWSLPAGRDPAFTIVLRRPESLQSLIARPSEITLGEAFVREDLDVEGDIFSVFQVSEHLFNRPHRLGRQALERLGGLYHGLGERLRHGTGSSRGRDHASIAYHYDLPLAFYQPWLGRSLVYSCAYFGSPEDSLDRAQEQKLELICRKLRLGAGQRILDIGCGWGSLVLYAAARRGARAEGITLSRAQAETASRRIREAGMSGCCSVALCDYRDLGRTPSGGAGSFDRISSVGMFEHVGQRDLPLYFDVVRSLLRPGGLFLNHGIARSATAPSRDDSFISRYVFPDGRLVTLAETLRAAEARGLEVRDVENLREHYELTLRRWVAGLRQNADYLLRQVSRSTYRIWLLYMAGSAAAFRRGDIAVHQVLFSRPDRGASGLPLTREDLYRR